MLNTVENSNTKTELYNLGGSLVEREEYITEIQNSFESCTGEIMFDASNEELNEYIKIGTPEEQRYARQEKCIRAKKTSHIPDKEIEKIISEMELSWIR